MKGTKNIALAGLLAAAVTLAVVTVLGSAGAEEKKAVKIKKYPNEYFYRADGTFDQEKAKQAYYEMFEAFGYPICDRLRSADFWVADFGLGNFAEVGMGGIFWLNNERDSYFGHEIFLLPGQMIPEHKHVKTAKAGPKMEGWQPRHGWIYTYGEGTPTPGVDERIPPSHRKDAVARTEQKLMPGETAELAGPEQWHWMQAPEGAIVTEYATFHDGDGLRFTLPNVKL